MVPLNSTERIRSKMFEEDNTSRINRCKHRMRKRTNESTSVSLSRRRYSVLFWLSLVRFVPFIDAFVSLHRGRTRTSSSFPREINICFSTSSPEKSSPKPAGTTNSTTAMFRPSRKASKDHQHRQRRKHSHNTQKQQQQQQQHDNRNSIRIMFQTAKTMERQGRWAEAQSMLEKILQKDPKDSHSHLALARLVARREKNALTPSTETITKAQEAFARGTEACPRNVFLLQAWAIYEQQTRGDLDRARKLFEECIEIDPYNPYVCHAFSLLEKQMGNEGAAMDLLKQVLDAPNTKVTAALVCTMGELYITAGNLTEARALYQYHISEIENGSNVQRRRKHLPSEKDRLEVYLAAAWLEEKHFLELETARDLLHKALAISPTSGLANVALARLEGRIKARDPSSSGKLGSSRSARFLVDARYNTTEMANRETAKRLAKICDELHQKGRSRSLTEASNEDGRAFNALATLEIKRKRFEEARDVLQKGMDLYPFDHNLFTAAGNVEERLGNHARARELYTESLRLEPSAPTLVAFALLELKYPEYPTTTSTETTIDKKHVLKVANFTRIRGLFEEALMLDPRNGPAYNAYGNAEARRGNLEEARRVFRRGAQANCTDAASIYHGYGMLEISCGNVEIARNILYEGLESVRQHQDVISADNPNRNRAAFLSHTLGMLELNANKPAAALTIFQDGLERCGNSSQLLLGAALSEMRLGKDDAARSLFERSVGANKKHAQAWQAWGVMETKAGHFNRASTLFHKGIQNAPWHGSLWHGYASLEVRRDNISNARTLFTGGLKKAKNRHDALYQGWATLEMREGNYEKARKLISEALTRNKQNGRGWIIAAQIEQEDGNDGLAELFLRRGIECDPDNAALYKQLGDKLLGKGKIDDAREVYEKGIDISPMYAPLYHSLAELEARICNLEALSRLNKRTNELFNNNVMKPAPGSDQALEAKLRNRPTVSSFFVDHKKQEQRQSRQSFRGGALSKKIGDDDAVDTIRQKNSTTNISSIEDLNGEGLVGDIMSVESILNDTSLTSNEN